MLRELFPVLTWGSRYSSGGFRADALAGTVVLFITVPQVIAYAFLAGMPAEAGLYAVVLSLLGYAVFGSSRALAVGPTAIVAMMTLEVASGMAPAGSGDYHRIVVQLCLLTGLCLVLLRVVNFGAVISFLSHAVVTGFISASAILIIFNQLPVLVGLPSSADTSLAGVAGYLGTAVSGFNTGVTLISLAAVAVMLFCKAPLGFLLRAAAPALRDALQKSAPMYAVLIGIAVMLVSGFTADQVPVVGAIPSGFPALQIHVIGAAEVLQLGPAALLIAMVIFMESTSIGTALASKSRTKIDANQELLGLGAANIGASVVGGFPVAGSFARSAVNFSAGAVSPVASLVTALLVIITLLLFAPAFYYLPKGVLAAIIVVSAWQLIDLDTIRKIFSFNRTDAVTFSLTFVAVLTFGVVTGVLVGILVSFALLIRSSSRPHIAVVGRVGESEQFRNIERYNTRTSPRVLALRVDESLYFVNTRYIENFLLARIADSEEIEHVLLICHAVNFIDTSGLEMLEELSENLAEVGVTLHLAEVKGPVMDKLANTGFYKHMSGQVFFTTDMAMKELAGV